MRHAIAMLIGISFICGCSDPNANIAPLTPELTEKIKAEDAAIDGEEGGKGAIRD